MFKLMLRLVIASLMKNRRKQLSQLGETDSLHFQASRLIVTNGKRPRFPRGPLDICTDSYIVFVIVSSSPRNGSQQRKPNIRNQ